MSERYRRKEEPKGSGHIEGARAKETFATEGEVDAKARADAYRASRRKSFAWKPPAKPGVDPDWDAFVMPKKAGAVNMRGTSEKPEATTMPKQADYPDMKDFANAMRSWREQQRTAKDGASALANRNK